MATVREKPASSRLDQMRSQIDIMACISNEAMKGTRKTRIMHRCNLSYRRIKPYLKLLLDIGVLKVTLKKGVNTTQFFTTTPKGREFVRAYQKLKILISARSL